MFLAEGLKITMEFHAPKGGINLTFPTDFEEGGWSIEVMPATGGVMLKRRPLSSLTKSAPTTVREKDVLEVIKSFGNQRFKADFIAEQLNLEPRQRNTLNVHIYNLHRMGKIERVGHGRYIYTRDKKVSSDQFHSMYFDFMKGKKDVTAYEVAKAFKTTRKNAGNMLWKLKQQGRILKTNRKRYCNGIRYNCYVALENI